MDLQNTTHCTVTSNDMYKDRVQVGNDYYENVKYHIFNHSWWRKKEAITFKDKLEDIWDTITTPFYRVKHKVRDAYWEARYGFQRMFKGYDSVDTFETFYKFIERYTKILTEYRKKHYGIPGEFIDKEGEWDAVIDEMLYHLKYMDEETVTDELEKDVPEDWSVDNMLVYEIMEKHKDEFFKLFSKYFYHLWD